MTSEKPEDGKKRLIRLARVAQWLCTLSIIGVLVLGVVALLNPEFADRSLREYLLEAPIVSPSVQATWAAKAVLAIASLVFCWMLVLAWRLFRFVERGTFYTQAAQNCLRFLGWTALAAALSNCVARTLVGILMTSSNPKGQMMLSIGFGSNEIISVIAGLLFFIFARIMQEFAAIHEDNQSII